MLRRILIVIGWLLAAFLAYNLYGMVMVSRAEPRVSEVVMTSAPAVIEPTMTQFVMPTIAPITDTPAPTPTSTPNPIQGWVLDGKIDLGSKKSTALSIRLPEGGELGSTWADAYAYEDGDVGVFDPHRGTIYSIMGDTIALYAHSGRVFYKPILFASNIDLYLRKSANGDYNLAQGKEALSKLVGTTAYLCQAEGVKPFTVFDPSYGCPGQMLELRLSAGVIVEQPNVPEFKQVPLSTLSWLIQRYPGQGFEFVSADNSFLFVTCVEKYPDQPPVEGVEYFEYNRAILAFTLVGE